VSNATVKLTGSGAFQDIGTISTSTSGLAGNMQSVNQILDVGLRNTSNIKDSFLRVSDLTGLGLATLNGNVLTVADLTSATSFSVNGTSGVDALVFSGATVSVSGGTATITVTGGGGTGTVTSVGITSTTLTVSGTVTTSGDLTVNLSSTQVSDLALAATALQPVTGLAGSYTNANLTLNSSGQITAASDGSGGGGSSPSAPVLIGSLVYWFDASKIASPAGSAVLTLGSPDQTRAPFIAYGGSGVVSSGTLNSLPVLTSSGAAGAAYTIASGAFNLGTGFTGFAVIKPSSFANYPVLTSGASGSLALYIDTGGHVTLGNIGVSSIAASTGVLTTGVWKQINASWTNTTGAWVFRIARAADSSGTTSNTATNPVTTLFDYGGGGEPYGGDVAEIIVYNRALTLTEKQSIEAYLLAKWGV